MNKKDIIYFFLIIVILYQLLEISCSTSRIAWLSTSEAGAGSTGGNSSVQAMGRGEVSPSCSLWLSFHEYPMTINYPIFGTVIYKTKDEFKETLFIP